MKVRIAADELYPVYFEENELTEYIIDMDEEFYKEWVDVLNKFEQFNEKIGNLIDNQMEE